MMRLFSDLALSRRLERTEAHGCAMYAEARAKISPAVGAEWMEVAGAYAVFDGPDSPVTQCFGLGLFEEVSAADFDRIELFFRERGAATNLEVSPMAGVGFYQRLHDRGYRPIELSSVLYRELDGEEPAAASGVRTRVISPGEEDLWAGVAARGWGESADTGFFRDFGRIAASKRDSVSFLAELDGAPIGAGALNMHDGVALLAGACTIPEGRRQGAQLALLYARLNYAAERGCELAMMCAEPGSSSQRNAERRGFRIAYTRTKWTL